VSGVPFAIFQGMSPVSGGMPSGAMNYQSQYNSYVNQDSPLELNISWEFTDTSIDMTVDAEVTGNISTTNNRIVYILTHKFDEDWFAVVTAYADETFTLTSVGQTQTFTHSFARDAQWQIPNLKAVAMVQTWNNDPSANKHRILQSGIAPFEGLFPLFSSDFQTGPASMFVQFTDLSLPVGDIDSWEWDLDGDGSIDSTVQNPSYLYTQEGSYDITLTITNSSGSQSVTMEDYIVITDGSAISGSVNGMWDASHNPYIITGDMDIPAGSQLLINSDVEIKVENEAQINVFGNLTAAGTGEDMIMIGSNSSWKGLRFRNAEGANSLQYCSITGATDAAIYIENDSEVLVQNCVLKGNSSSAKGAAIDISSDDNVIIKQNIITGNSSTTLAGAIGLNASNPTISNNLIVNNSGKYGALSFKTGSDATLINNTIANNAQDAAGALFFLFNANPTFENCIIQHDGTLAFAPTGEAAISYSCVSGGYTGTGNIDADPLFASPTAGSGVEYNGLLADWSLQAGSPCIDAGNPDAIYNDLDGSRNDMGAYGYQGYINLTDAPHQVTPATAQAAISIYPNPFNPSTTIALSISDADLAQPLTAGIYNIRGQLVKTLVDDAVVTQRSFSWNGRDDAGNQTASGLYFVKVHTASSTTAAKMVMMK
jgi:PKD repeat protein